MAASQASAHVDCDQRSDVGNREAIAGNEMLPVQFAIHPFETLTSHRSLSFPQEDQRWLFLPRSMTYRTKAFHSLWRCPVHSAA